MIVVRIVGVDGSSGKIEASTTRKPCPPGYVNDRVVVVVIETRQEYFATLLERSPTL
jgi:hypothetical protein